MIISSLSDSKNRPGILNWTIKICLLVLTLSHPRKARKTFPVGEVESANGSVSIWGHVRMRQRKIIAWRQYLWTNNKWSWYIGARITLTFIAQQPCLKFEAKLNCRSWKRAKFCLFLLQFSQSSMFAPIFIPDRTH